MKRYNIVLDTNVLVSALRSRRGFSYKLISQIDDKRIDLFISVPVILEYEDVLKRKTTGINLTRSDIDDLIDYICHIGKKREIYYLWRPFLKDRKDDMFLELAVESGSEYLITFNKKDFSGCEKFGVTTLTPKEFINITGINK